MRYLIAFLLFAGSFTSPVFSQKEDTTQFIVFNNEDSKRLLADQLYKSFETRQIGLLPLMMEDTVELSMRLKDSTLSECMLRHECIKQLGQFFENVPYVGFQEFTGLIEDKPVVILKIYMDAGDPNHVVYMYFIVEPKTIKIEKIHIE